MRWLLIVLFMALASVSSAAFAAGSDNDPSVNTPAYQTNQNDDNAKPKENDQGDNAGNAWPKFTPSDTYANWVIAFCSVIAAVASVWAAWLVGRSLRLTREATNAAVEANSITRDLFAAENRPWIRFAKPVEVGNYWDSNSGGHISVTALLKNTGKTPAVDVCASVVFDVLGPLSFLNNKPIADFAEREVLHRNPQSFGKIAVFVDSDPLPEITASSNDIPTTDKTIRAIFCVTYRASGFETVYYTAIAVEFEAGAIVNSGGDIAVPEHDAYYTKIPNSVISGSLVMS